MNKDALYRMLRRMFGIIHIYPDKEGSVMVIVPNHGIITEYIKFWYGGTHLLVGAGITGEIDLYELTDMDVRHEETLFIMCHILPSDFVRVLKQFLL